MQSCRRGKIEPASDDFTTPDAVTQASELVTNVLTSVAQPDIGYNAAAAMATACEISTASARLRHFVSALRAIKSAGR